MDDIQRAVLAAYEYVLLHPPSGVLIAADAARLKLIGEAALAIYQAEGIQPPGVSVEAIEASSLHESDPAWSFTDPAGHEHRWEGDWQTSSLPTCDWVWDELVDPDSDYPRHGHYACNRCGARVVPLTISSPERRFIPGIRSLAR